MGEAAMQLEGLSKDPLTNQVVRAIRDLILRGDVMPGEYLPPQHVLAVQLGVGLSTIREAVKALSVLGLLEAYPGRGTLVLPDALKILNSEAAMKASLGPVELEQVLEARLVLEAALTRMAAERATDDDVREIQSCLAEMEGAIPDNERFARADVRFHLAVARASKNDVLAQTYYFIHSLLEQAIVEADALPGGKERALVNHRALLDGIRTHDPAKARAASDRQIIEVSLYSRSGAREAQ
jgi:DNA-binding FadR family transcriptional regulator